MLTPILAYAPLAGGALAPPCGTGTPTVSTFAGDGISYPWGLAFDAAGNLYVANTISKVTPAGVVSTFVSSGLDAPEGLALDSAGIRTRRDFSPNWYPGYGKSGYLMVL
jgi:DNA-binding beta-propeller fold protein YncE